MLKRMTGLSGSSASARSNHCCACSRSPDDFSARPSCTSAPRSLGWCLSSSANSAVDSVNRPSRAVRSTQLPPCVPVAGRGAQPLAQCRDPTIVIAGAEIRDFQIALRDPHLRVQLERARECRDGLLVTDPCGNRGRRGCCARPRRTDRCGGRRNAGHRGPVQRGGWSRRVAVTPSRPPRSPQATRTARRIAWSDATSGRSRKKPRKRSFSSCMKNSVSTQNT